MKLPSVHASFDSRPLRKRQVSVLLAVIVFGALVAGAAIGTETVTYTYDARGRVKSVVRTGTVNNNVQTTYTYDKANSRKTKNTSGSPNSPPP